MSPVFSVDGVADSDRIETVYNLEIEDKHTYFQNSLAATSVYVTPINEESGLALIAALRTLVTP